MYDVNNTKLEVGDKVAYCAVGYSYLQRGYVLKLTPNGATVDATKDAKRGLPRTSSQLCKIV